MSERRRPAIASPATIRKLWVALIAVLVLTLAVEPLVSAHHDGGSLKDSFGFGAWYGFLSCVVLVLGSRLVGLWLKRRDDFYDPAGDKTGGGE